MNTIKQFLKPNWWKMGGFIGIALLSSLYVRNGSRMIVDLPALRGFPFPFYSYGGFTYPPTEVIYLGLIMDVIIWYLISCLVYFIFKNIFSMKEIKN